MKIKIECPVCRAKNELNLANVFCRRCKEDLSLLYRAKAYSFKYRLYFIQQLSQPQSFAKRQRLIYAATHLVNPPKGISFGEIEKKEIEEE